MSNLFNINGSNFYWEQLQAANKLHVQQRQVYLNLLQRLKSDGVKFEDIRKFLKNQAKKVGLYRATEWNDKKGKMDFPAWNTVKKFAWATSMDNFTGWVSQNYVSYDRKKDKVIKAPKKKETKKVITRKTNGEVVTNEITSSEMTAPIVSDTSSTEVLAMILNNLDVLGHLAQEKGAKKEWNMLMTKMGEQDAILRS